MKPRTIMLEEHLMKVIMLHVTVCQMQARYLEKT